MQYIQLEHHLKWVNWEFEYLLLLLISYIHTTSLLEFTPTQVYIRNFEISKVSQLLHPQVKGKVVRFSSRKLSIHCKPDSIA